MIDSEYVRREARESELEHVSAMSHMRDSVGRLFHGDVPESAATKAAFVTGLDRRGFLRIGGISIAAAAVFAACGNDDEGGAAAEEEVDGEGLEKSDSDVTILRTASSLEALAIDVYQRAIDSGLLITTAVADAAKLFQEQHTEHAGLFIGATKQLGGEVFDKPNPVLLQSLQPALNGLRDEPGVVRLAYDLENAAAATYFSTVGAFENAKLNQSAMSVGGVEARHAAVFAAVIGQPQVPRVFQTVDGAVAPGTGV